MAARPLPEIEDVSFNYADLLRRLTLSGEELLTPSVVAAAVQNLPGPTKPSGSPGQLQDASSLDSNASGQISLSWGGRSPGKASPFRGRTMKEYEEQLATLKKDNFALKLRIYFLEERMGQKCDRDDKDDLYRTNIELKVETEALKQELYDKQELVRQASTALASLEHQYQEQLDHARRQHVQETQQLNSHVQALQKEVESYADQLQQGAQGRLGELTQLCGLAFSTEEGETALAPSATSNPLDLSAYPNPLAAHSPVQGVFSLPSVGPDTNALKKSHPSLIAEEDAAGRGMEQEEEEEEGSEVEQLRERVVELEGRVEELEEELAQRQDMSVILQEDLDNLRKEVEEKVEKIGQLEQEVAEKDERVEVAMQELEMQHSELAAKDHLIQSLHQDLHREPHLTSQVEPEIEVKVQEIVERDRIIEEKIEQIEQQNKILVEIQITLDEKQKQLADMEQKVEESEQKVTKLTQDLDKSCKVIQSLAEEVHARDKEIANLKKELKRKEKKVRDLVAELKETLDMLKKAKWEAETSGGEDGVKEMAEEENEVRWSDIQVTSTALLLYTGMEDQGRRKERVERVAGRQSRLQGVEEGHRTIPKPSERKVLGQDRMESVMVRSSLQEVVDGHRTIPNLSERKVLGQDRMESALVSCSSLQGFEKGHRTIPNPSERKVLGQDRMESALVRCSSFQGFEKGHRTIPKPSERKVLGQDRMDSALVSCSSLQGFEKGHRTIPNLSERKVLGQDRMDSVMVSSCLQGVDSSNITFCRECKRVLGQGERVASCPCFPGAEESYRARLHERGSQESVERLVVDPFLHGVGESHGTVPRLCERRVLEAPPCCMAQEGEGWSRRARERSVGQTWTCTEGLHKGYGNETFIFPRHSHTATPIITTPPSPSPSTSTTNLLPCYPHHHLPMPPSTRPQQPQLKAQPMSSSVSCGSGMYRPFPQRPCSCHAYLHCDHD